MSMHYRVKRRCPNLLHNAVGLIISITLLTFASSIRQKAPHDLVILWFMLNRLNSLHWKCTTADKFLSAFSSKWFFKGGLGDFD